MKKSPYLCILLLAAVVGTAMLILMLCRSFQPAVVLPVLNIPNILTLSVIALVLEYYLSPGSRCRRIPAGLLAAVTFGILPWAAGVVPSQGAWKLALAGGLIFSIADGLFRSMTERLPSGPAGKPAAAVTGLVLILAGQCFAGILL